MEAPDGADAALPARVRVRINCAKLLLAEVDPRDKERNCPCPDAGIAVPRADARACISRKSEL